MAKYRVLLLVLATLLFTASSLPAQLTYPGVNYETNIEVQGVRTDDGRFRLTVGMVSYDAPNLFDALIVRSHPSGELLFAYSDATREFGTLNSADPDITPEMREGVRFGKFTLDEALSYVQGNLDSFSQEILVSFDPVKKEDQQISVELVLNNLVYTVVQVPMDKDGKFGVATNAPATHFLRLEEGPRLGTRVIGVTCAPGERCSRCNTDCGWMAVCCDGPAFNCNVQACTVSCGTWPPECV